MPDVFDLVPREGFERAAAEFPDLLREVLGPGAELDVFSLPRVRVPAGGGLTWELPDGTTAQTLQGTIILVRRTRAFWREPFSSGGGNPPDCWSEDAVTGRGDPGGECARCPFAQWGSATGPDGQRRRGQACRLITRVFLLPPGNLLPILIPAPPSSKKAVDSYVVSLLSRGLAYWRVTTAIGLERARSREGIGYSRLTLRMEGTLSPEQARWIEEYRGAIMHALMKLQPVVEEAVDAEVIEEVIE